MTDGRIRIQIGGSKKGERSVFHLTKVPIKLWACSSITKRRTEYKKTQIHLLTKQQINTLPILKAIYLHSTYDTPFLTAPAPFQYLNLVRPVSLSCNSSHRVRWADQESSRVQPSQRQKCKIWWKFNQWNMSGVHSKRKEWITISQNSTVVGSIASRLHYVPKISPGCKPMHPGAPRPGQWGRVL